MWFASPIGLHLDCEFPMREFTTRFLASTDSSGIGSFLAILYCIWETRNNLLFCRLRVSLEKILCPVCGPRPSLVVSRLVLQPQTTLLPTLCRHVGEVVKLNFDAFVFPLSLAGFGCVAS